MSYGTEIPGRCSECGRVTDTLPCPHCMADLTRDVPDKHLRRCRGCGQWKDERVECVLCVVDAQCMNCKHPVVEHSGEPGVGCLHQMPPNPPFALYPTCPCFLPGTSGADQ